MRLVDISDEPGRCVHCLRFNSKKHSNATRRVICINDEYMLRYAKYFCHACNKYFSNSTTVSGRGKAYSEIFVNYAVAVAVGKILKDALEYIEQTAGHRPAMSTLHKWIQEWEEQYAASSNE